MAERLGVVHQWLQQFKNRPEKPSAVGARLGTARVDGLLRVVRAGVRGVVVLGQDGE